MAAIQERKTVSSTGTPLAIEAPKPAKRIRYHKDYRDDMVINDRNPHGITSVTVIVTKADGTATSETWTAAELSEYTDDRTTIHTQIDSRTITIRANEWFQWQQ